MDPSGAVTTFAGNGNVGKVDGPLASASFFYPSDIAFGKNGVMYVADSANGLIRKIENGVVSTVPTRETIYALESIAVAPDGQLYATDASARIVRITPDGKKIYTANGLSNDVSVIDVGAERVTKTIQAGDGPWGVALLLHR